MHFTFWLENDKLNQSELNGKNNENDEIFEVPGHNENLRRRIFIWLNSLWKNSEIHGTGGVWPKIVKWKPFGGILFLK